MAAGVRAEGGRGIGPEVEAAAAGQGLDLGAQRGRAQLARGLVRGAQQGLDPLAAAPPSSSASAWRQRA